MSSKPFQTVFRRYFVTETVPTGNTAWIHPQLPECFMHHVSRNHGELEGSRPRDALRLFVVVAQADSLLCRDPCCTRGGESDSYVPHNSLLIGVGMLSSLP